MHSRKISKPVKVTQQSCTLQKPAVNQPGCSLSTQGLNDTGQPTGTHHYHFIVYALDTKLSIDAKTDKAALEKGIQGHILAQGELVGLYKKSKQ